MPQEYVPTNCWDEEHTGLHRKYNYMQEAKAAMQCEIFNLKE